MCGTSEKGFDTHLTLSKKDIVNVETCTDEKCHEHNWSRAPRLELFSRFNLAVKWKEAADGKAAYVANLLPFSLLEAHLLQQNVRTFFRIWSW